MSIQVGDQRIYFGVGCSRDLVSRLTLGMGLGTGDILDSKWNLKVNLASKYVPARFFKIECPDYM